MDNNSIWILFAAILLAALVGPFLGVLPKGREKRVMQLRARAIESGLDVQFVREKDDQGRTKLKYVPGSRIPWAEYRLTLPESAAQEWHYQARQQSDNQQELDWQLYPELVELPEGVKNGLVRCRQSWPATLPHFSVKRQGRSLWVTWDEEGGLEEVDLIVELLHEIAKSELGTP